MSRMRDISGEKFNRLTAVEPIGKSGKEVLWLCKCECGNTTRVKLSNLTNNNTKSCGCWRIEARYKRGK